MENERIDADGMKINGGFFKWLENFWYHYKWHSLIALFLVFTVTICTLQMCEKEKYDVNVLYAGGHAFSRESEGADYSEYQKIMSGLKSFTEDHDGDGKVSVSFRDLYAPTEDELANEDEDVYFSRAYEDKQILTSTMMTGEYFLCFFSPEVFESYDKVEGDGVGVFTVLPSVLPDGSSVEYYNDKATGIKLSSLDLYSLAGFSSMPEDTVIAIRNTAFSTHLDDDRNTRDYERSLDMLLKMTSYDAP